jgi:hypothetical protein
MLGNWAGYLLAIDAVVALLERYLGETVEKSVGWKIKIPFGLKLGFAIVVLFIAQVLAYRDLQSQLLQEAANNEQLRNVIAKNGIELTRLGQENTDLRKRPEACQSSVAVRGKPLDILCQHLADCPSEELAKRASELIAKLRAIMEPYDADVQGWENALRGEQFGSPAYNDLQARMAPSLGGSKAIVMGKYRHLHTEVVAMREALIKRVGYSDEDEDFDYQLVGTEQGNTIMVDGVIRDLSKLTADVRNLRQH